MKDMIKKCLNYNCNSVYDTLRPFSFVARMYGLAPYKWNPKVTENIFSFNNFINMLAFIINIVFYFYVFFKLKEVFNTMFGASDLLTIGSMINVKYCILFLTISYAIQLFMVRRISLTIQTIHKIDKEVCC